MLGPKGGATLVAVDQESLDPHARTIEEGRRFRGAWSFNRSDAYAQVLRLRAQLRLALGTADRIDVVLRAVLDEPEPMRQDWWEVPLRFLGDRMDGLLRERAAAVAELEALREDEAERDPRTGLYTAAFLERWTRGLGAGTLPIGLVLLRVFGVAELRGQYGLRAELAALQGLREGISELLQPTDRLVRIGREDFLVGAAVVAERRGAAPHRRDLRADRRAGPGLPVRRVARRRRGHRDQGAPAAGRAVECTRWPPES